MLFSIKNKAVLSLAATLVFAALSILLKHLLGLDWNLYIGRGVIEQLFTGLGFMLASDIVLVILLLVIFHTGFVRLWMEMAAYFSPQRIPAVLSGGLLAAGEEMFFRGVLLQYMVQALGLNPYYAVAVSAAAFALCHVIWKKRLALFSLWAFWEGVILGAIYLYTGSLPVVMAVHAAHDIAGFALFSLQRRRGFLVVIKHPGFRVTG
jgi:membrane protease YdiL (CAAX protease family)